jgi:hypothetical protein
LSRPAIAAERLSLTPQGDVHFCLKTSYRDRTTHIVLAPGSALRVAVTPSGRGQGASKPRAEEGRGAEGATSVG